jgi:hypothetical protein
MTVIQTPEVQWVVSLLQLKLGYACDIFIPTAQPQEKMCSSHAFHVDERFESSSTYDIINSSQPSCPLRIRHSHELQ